MYIYWCIYIKTTHYIISHFQYPTNLFQVLLVMCMARSLIVDLFSVRLQKSQTVYPYF